MVKFNDDERLQQSRSAHTLRRKMAGTVVLLGLLVLCLALVRVVLTGDWLPLAMLPVCALCVHAPVRRMLDPATVGLDPSGTRLLR